MPDPSPDPSQSPASDAPPGLDGSRVCVTGGAGFIGSRLAGRLLDLGARVRVIDDLSASDMGPVAELLDNHPERFDFVRASILEPGALREAVQDASIVFHLAAISAAGVSLDEPRRVFDVNAAGTQRVAEAARQAGARRLVYAASSSAYGLAGPPHAESRAPEALSPYAAAKLAGEHVVSAYAHSMGLPGASLRLFNVYGPGQRLDSAYAAVVPAFIDRALAGEPLVVHGTGDQTRDFVFVDDVVRAFLLAAGRTSAGPAPINIGTGAAVTVRALAETILGLVGRESDQIEHASARPGDVPHSRADVSRARDVLGFTAGVSLEEGLRRTIEARRDDRETEPTGGALRDA